MSFLTRSPIFKLTRRNNSLHCIFIPLLLYLFPLQVLQFPLGLKYACPSATTWKLAVQCLLEILPVGLPVARQPSSCQHFTEMWPDLAAVYELFLFSEQWVLGLCNCQVCSIYLILPNIIHVISQWPFDWTIPVGIYAPVEDSCRTCLQAFLPLYWFQTKW